MGYIVRMPKLGLEMEQGTLTTWYHAEGESVEAGEPIAEIESEKTSAEVDAREDGVLRHVYLVEGDGTEPGGPIAIVAGPDEDISALEAEAERDTDTAAAEAAEESARAESEPSEASTAAEPRPAATGGGGQGTADVKASPRAQKRAEELGVDLTTIEGTGPDGAVTADDVEAASETEAPSPTAGGATRTVAETRTFEGMRSTIARRLGESYRNAVHVTIHRTADASALRAATAAADEALDVDVSMTDLLLVALSETLASYPAFNATFEDGDHVLYEEHNVNVAVDVEAGLVTPVVPDVGGKSLAEIAETRRQVTEKTLAGEYTMDDLSGGTFTVSNLGHLGVEAFDPIINPPQIAILGVDALDERVEPVEGGFETTTVLPLDLSFDHRVVDGADAARFVGTLVEHLENPWPLLVGSQTAPTAAASGVTGSATLPTSSFEDADRRAVTDNAAESSGTFTIDDHEYAFGLETAPTPPEIFLGALESCLALTLRNVGLEMGIDVEAVFVDGALRPESGAVEGIEMVVTVDVPDAADEDLDALLSAAEAQCHVANLLREDLSTDISIERL